MLIVCVCVCVCVCVYRSKKIFLGLYMYKFNQNVVTLLCQVHQLLKNSKPGKGVQAPYGPRPHIHTYTHTHTHTHKYTGICILMLCIQQLECGVISGGMKCLNQLCLPDHAGCWVVPIGCDKLMYSIQLAYVCI